MVHVDLQFTAIAALRPDAPALEERGGQLSYGELEARADEVAGQLRSLGVRSEVTVAVLLEKSEAFLVALLAIWKIGGTAVPVHPGWPPARLRHVLVRVSPSHVIDRDGARSWLAPGSSSAFAVDGRCKRETGADADRRAPAVVVSTCEGFGASGLVQISHDALAQRVEVVNESAPIEGADRVAWVSPAWSAYGMGEVWSALCAGACLVVPPEDVLARPRQLQAWLISSAIAVAFLPMPLAGPVCSREWTGAGVLRRLVIAAEPSVRPSGLRVPVPVVLHFGDAEAFVFSFLTLEPGDAVEPRFRSLGRPSRGVEWRIDGGTGNSGELLVSSPCMASAYDRAGIEQPDGFVREAGRIFHRTGIVAAIGSPASELAFVGYSDRRVSVAGTLIRWREIERVLLTHPDVKAARLEPASSEQDLRDCRIVVESRRDDLTPAELARFLQDWIPFTLIPRHVSVATPASAQLGATRRDAVGGPVGGGRATAELVQAIVGIWSSTIEDVPVSQNADFLEIGGNSFHAALIKARIEEEFGLRLKMRDLIRLRTPAQQAEHIAGRSEAVNAAPAGQAR